MNAIILENLAIGHPRLQSLSLSTLTVKKGFIQELYLIIHLKIYTVEKPYELYVCGKAFECFESENLIEIHIS